MLGFTLRVAELSVYGRRLLPCDVFVVLVVVCGNGGGVAAGN